MHVGAIAHYRVRRGEDLVGPMLHGDKKLRGEVAPSRDDWTTRLLAAVMLILSGGLVAWLVSFGD